MRALVVIGLIVLSGCASTAPKPSTTPTYFASGKFATDLEAQVAAIEASVPAGWSRFSRLSGRLDGERSETFSVACAYLARRDPSLFLRRHIAGDSRAIGCGRAAYGWSGLEFRRVLDSVYRFRLLEAKSATERLKVEEFIAQTTTKTQLGDAADREQACRLRFSCLPLGAYAAWHVRKARGS